jgi:hypothetical protein
MGRACAAATVLAAICAAFLLSTSHDAVAKKFVGTAKSDKIAGTKKSDKIKGRDGNDRLKGKKGKDRLSGGPGNDRINAVDRARDRKVKGGKGTDICIIDGVDLRKVRSCDELKVKNRGAGAPGKDSLLLTSATGLECDQQLPLCPFQLEGTGADSPVGTVTGGGDVTLAAGPSLAIQGEDWTAVGLYGCTGKGFLRVDIGAKSIEVPITCTTAP